MLNHNHNDAFGKHAYINYSARSLLSFSFSVQLPYRYLVKESKVAVSIGRQKVFSTQPWSWYCFSAPAV